MGTLYIVATPIGNLQDITLRAIETLNSVDIIVCEDTRVTQKLLHHYHIDKKTIVLNDFNENEKFIEILQLLETHTLALVSDAGTPLIADPGFKVVREARKKGIKIETIPGPSSPIAALSIAGVPTNAFYFLGFLPKSPVKIENLFISLKEIPLSPTFIVFEAPHRLMSTLEILQKTFGDIEISVARELTKINEEVLEDKLSTIQKHFHEKNPRGEFVLLFNLKQ